MSDRQILVSNTEQLLSALSASQSGGTIVLAAGKYDALSIKNFNPDSLVTIKSSDPHSLAWLSSLKIDGSSNLRFFDLEIGRPLTTGESDTFQVAMLTRVTDVTLGNISFHGSLDGDNSNDPRGLRIVEGQRIRVIDSEFQQLRVATSVFDSRDVVFAFNDVSEVREGLDVANTDTILIEDNRFQRLAPVGGEHTDAIQFFTTNEVNGVSNATLRNNAFLLGDNPLVGTQGIFISSQVPGVRHSNITVQNNVYYGASVHGISVNDTDGAIISKNTVLTSPNMANKGTGEIIAAIRMSATTGAVVSENISTFITYSNGTTASLADNIIVASAKTPKGVAVTDLFHDGLGGFATGAQSSFLASKSGLSTIGSSGDVGFQGQSGWGDWLRSAEGLEAIYLPGSAPIGQALLTSLGGMLSGKTSLALIKTPVLAESSASDSPHLLAAPLPPELVMGDALFPQAEARTMLPLQDHIVMTDYAPPRMFLPFLFEGGFVALP